MLIMNTFIPLLYRLLLLTNIMTLTFRQSAHSLNISLKPIAVTWSPWQCIRAKLTGCRLEISTKQESSRSLFFLIVIYFPVKIYLVSLFNSLSASSNFCHLLIASANDLDQDQDRENLGPDLDSNCLTL